MRQIVLVIIFSLFFWFSFGVKPSRAGACMCDLVPYEECGYYTADYDEYGNPIRVWDCLAKWKCPVSDVCSGTIPPFLVCGPNEVTCGSSSNPACCPVPTSPPGCTPNCGGSYCGTKSNGCGGRCACHECGCLVQCGQASDCGTCGYY